MKPEIRNDSAHCLQQWREDIERGDQPTYGAIQAALHADLSRAVKFSLPEGGRVVDDFGGVARLFKDLRLPFPVVALEYRSSGVVADHEYRSSRRIALVWDARQATPQLLQVRGAPAPAGTPGLYVQTICFMDDVGPRGTWMPVLATAYVDLTATPTRPRLGDVSAFEMDLVRHRLPADFDKQPAFPVGFTAHSSEVVEILGGREAAEAVFRADTGDEIGAALAFAAMSTCANVRMRTEPAPVALNRKRERNGKVPFFDTCVLEVDPGQGGYVRREAGGAGMLGGTHASPRAHLRRGHIRMVGDRAVWINATTVNAARDALVHGSYAIRPAVPFAAQRPAPAPAALLESDECELEMERPRG